MATPAVAFDQLEIKEGMLSYVNDSSNQSVMAQGLSLNTSLDIPQSGKFISKGKLDIDTLRTTYASKLPPMKVAMSYSASYDQPGKLLTVSSAKLSLNDLAVAVEGTLNHSPGAFAANGSVESADIPISALLSFVPDKFLASLEGVKIDGLLGLKADVNYQPSSADTLKYSTEMSLSNLSLSGGKIPGDLKFGAIHVSAEKDHARLSSENGSFNGKPLKLHAVIETFADPSVTAEIAGQLDLAMAQPFLPSAGHHEVTGAVDIEAKIAGRIKDIKSGTVSGRIRVPKGAYRASMLPEPIDSFSLDLSFNQEVVRIDTFRGAMKSGTVAFSGRITGLYDYLMADSVRALSLSPAIDGKLDVSGDLAVAQAYLPQSGNPRLGGSLAMSVSVQGPIRKYEEIRPNGTVTIRKASYHDSLLPEPITQLDADLLISPETLSVTAMTVRFVSSDVSMKGKLTNPFPYLLPSKNLDRSTMTKPLFLFSLSSHRFDLDKLFPEAVPGAGEGGGATMDSVSPMILPDINGRGTVEIDTMIYSRVEFTNITGQVRIFDRKIECSGVKGKAYSGDVSGSTTIDLNDFASPRYTGEFKATQIEANDFATRFSPLSGILYGKLDVTGTYDARGWEPSDFLNSLTLNGKGSTQNAKLITSGFALDAIRSVATKFGKDVGTEHSLKGLASNIAVKDGMVSFDNLKTVIGDIGDLELTGGYKFAGGLSYSGTVLLSREWSEKLLKSGLAGGLAGLFTESSTERIKLPLSIGGTMEKPSLTVDYAGIAKNLKSSLKNEAGNLLEGLFKKK
ncbi:MAG: AsmA-like C-terminal region-containing protein [Candidatus Zixiibacteriota bacterium]